MQPRELAHQLRELLRDDAEWIYRACQDDEIQRWTTVPRPYKYEHAEFFVRGSSDEHAAFAIIHSASGQPVGVAGIHEVRGGVASVGYWVAPWGRGRGAASDALQILQTIIARDTDARAVRALIAETNTVSRRTAEHAGFKLVSSGETTCPDGINQVVAVCYEKDVR